MRRTRHPPPRDRRARSRAARRRLCERRRVRPRRSRGARSALESNRSASRTPRGGGPLRESTIGPNCERCVLSGRFGSATLGRGPGVGRERVSRALPSDAPGTRAFRSRRFGSKRGFRREKRRAFPFDFRFLDSLMVPSLMTMARVWLANGVCRVRSPRRNRGRGHDEVEASRRAAFAQRPELVARRRRRRRRVRVLRVRVFRVRFEHRLEDARPLVLRLLGGAAPRQKRDSSRRASAEGRALGGTLRFAPREEALEERGAILLLGRQRERRRERRVRGASGRRLDALRFQPNQLRLELAKTRRRRRFFVPVGDVSVSVSVRGRRVESRQRIENRLLSLLLFLGERAIRAQRRRLRARLFLRRSAQRALDEALHGVLGGVRRAAARVRSSSSRARAREQRAHGHRGDGAAEPGLGGGRGRGRGARRRRRCVVSVSGTARGRRSVFRRFRLMEAAFV